MNCRTNPLTICALTNDSEQIGSFAPPTELSEVIVVESGHAGCEEAITAARLGLNTALLTLNLDRIRLAALQSCSWRTAKSQLVHEVDALSGMIGRLAVLPPYKNGT